MFKKIVFVILVLVALAFVFYQIVDEPLPEGEEGPRAEWLTDQVFDNLNKAAWDSLENVSWSSPGGHHYKWNKRNNQVEVIWSDYRAVVFPNDRTGQVWENGDLMETDEQEYVDKALAYFFNDSFWLIAPYKLRDPGTIRKVVNYEGKEALMVQYTSGGVTPGDTYLWILNEEHRPIAWKFWVKILPIGGMEFTWENWEDIKGAQISTLHGGILDIKIENLKSE